MSDDYRPRRDDHLVEPFFGAFEGEEREGREDEPLGRGGMRLGVALLIVIVLAAVIWLSVRFATD